MNEIKVIKINQMFMLRWKDFAFEKTITLGLLVKNCHGKSAKRVSR